MWEALMSARWSARSRRCTAAVLAGAVACAAPVMAQTTTEMGGAVAQFEVFDPSANGGQGAWTTFMTAQPGQRVEWRVKFSYVGTRTDLFAIGEVLYQPTIENADNVDAGDGIDTLGPWRNGGNGGNSIVGSMLSGAEGNDGGPLPSYGRVRFGGTATAGTGSNTITTFRHSNGSDNAPPGEWIRIAGSSVSEWPAPSFVCDWVACSYRTLRGVSAQQQSYALNSTYHIQGTQNLVTFRQALLLSNSTAPRIINISTFDTAFRRVANTGSDDTRFISWQTSFSDSGSHRTLFPAIAPATVIVNGPVCDTIDFNRDSVFPDTQDLTDFLSVFAGGACPTNNCGDIDFNNDAIFPDIADMDTILRVFSGGPCE